MIFQLSAYLIFAGNSHAFYASRDFWGGVTNIPNMFDAMEPVPTLSTLDSDLEKELEKVMDEEYPDPSCEEAEAEMDPAPQPPPSTAAAAPSPKNRKRRKHKSSCDEALNEMLRELECDEVPKWELQELQLSSPLTSSTPAPPTQTQTQTEPSQSLRSLSSQNPSTPSPSPPPCSAAALP